MGLGFTRQHTLAALFALAGALPAFAGEVQLTAADGTGLSAIEYGTGERGVVLVHAEGRSSEDWTYFAGKLETSGFHVLALDLRGHGASTPPDSVDKDAWPTVVPDVTAAIDWLKGKGATSISLVGAEIGANLAVHAAAAEPLVSNLVLLSPGMNLHGVMCSGPLTEYGARPVLLVASAEDAYATKSVRFLESKAVGTAHVVVLDSAGAGTKMLNRSVDLEGTVISWLTGEHERIKAGQEATSRELTTGDTPEIETSGVKFGD